MAQKERKQLHASIKIKVIADKKRVKELRRKLRREREETEKLSKYRRKILKRFLSFLKQKKWKISCKETEKSKKE